MLSHDMLINHVQSHFNIMTVGDSYLFKTGMLTQGQYRTYFRISPANTAKCRQITNIPKNILIQARAIINPPGPTLRTVAETKGTLGQSTIRGQVIDVYLYAQLF
jgi:hypothetical protein